jgi:hypothetical protein
VPGVACVVLCYQVPGRFFQQSSSKDITTPSSKRKTISSQNSYDARRATIRRHFVFAKRKASHF